MASPLTLSSCAASPVTPVSVTYDGVTKTLSTKVERARRSLAPLAYRDELNYILITIDPAKAHRTEAITLDVNGVPLALGGVALQ